MIQIVNSSFPLLHMLEFCSNAIGDDRPNAVNMDPIDWENKPHTLLYLLYKEKRFDGPRAGYAIKTEGGRIVTGHGWYPSDWDSNIYVQSRAYQVPGYLRSKGLGLTASAITSELFFVLEDCAIQQGYLGGTVTLEHYNESFLHKGVKLNDPSRYPEYSEERKGNLIVKQYRKPGVRMRQSKMCEGTYLIRNAEQFVYYYLFDWTYEKQFLENLECHRITND